MMIISIASTNVVRIPYFEDSDVAWEREEREVQRIRNVGVLPSGERYVIYRASLYADGFQQNKAVRQSRSVGGCYLLPLGLSSAERGQQRELGLCV